MSAPRNTPPAYEEVDLRRPRIPRAPSLPRLTGLGVELSESGIRVQAAAPPPLPTTDPHSILGDRPILETDQAFSSLPSLPPLSPPLHGAARLALVRRALGAVVLASLLATLGSWLV